MKDTISHRAERPLYSQFSYSQISGGGKGGKTSISVEERQLYSDFSYTRKKKKNIFPGGKF